MKTIVLSGGHLSPAVAVAHELKKRGYRVIVFGRGYAFSEAPDKPSLEKEMFSEMGVEFHEIDVPRTPSTFLSYPRYIASVMRSKNHITKSLREINPVCVISFGGYVAIPLLIAAQFLKIPIFLHEQTTVAGQSNKMFSFIAQKVFTSWPETLNSFSKQVWNKVLLTGNPVRGEILSLTDQINLKKKKEMTVYITGGSTGAHAINVVVANSLENLLKKYRVIHQAGDSHFNDLDLLEEKKNSLPKELQKKYRLLRYVGLSEIKKIYEETDILVGRSGANTVTEAALLGIPSIFIPLPLAQYNEQELLANKLTLQGVGVTLLQRELNDESLTGALEKITNNYEEYVKQGESYRQSEDITRHKTACRDIVDHIELWSNRSGNFHS